MKRSWLDWLDKILIVDVFVVFLGFAWFAIAVIGHSTGIHLGWELWLQLWQPIFNPAIGILFLGAFASWGMKKINQYRSAHQVPPEKL